MEKLKEYSLLVAAIIILFLGLSLADKCNKNHPKVIKGKETTISDKIDTTSNTTKHTRDSIFIEHWREHLVYRDTSYNPLIKDTSITSYTKLIEDTNFVATIIAKVKGKLEYLDLQYKLRDMIIHDSIIKEIVIKEAIVKLRVDTIRIKPSIINLGGFVGYSVGNMKADIGPSVLIDLNRVKIGYNYSIGYKSHQLAVLFPIKYN